MMTHIYVVEPLPLLPPSGDLPRFGARLGFSPGISYIEFDPALSRVAQDTVKRHESHNRDWYVDTRDQYYFASEADRNAFVERWNGTAC